MNENESRRRWFRFMYVLSRILLGWLYPIRVYGRENVPEGAALICPNHSNNVDPFLVCLAMGKSVFCRHLAKIQTKSIPIFGRIMEKLGSIFVNRGEQDIDAYKQCIRLLKGGEKLMVFPEGTRVHGDAVVEPKSGVIRMAAKTGVPIVPVYLPRDKKIFRPCPIVIGEPYCVQNAERGDYDRLAHELMDRIWALKR